MALHLLPPSLSPSATLLFPSLPWGTGCWRCSPGGVQTSRSHLPPSPCLLSIFTHRVHLHTLGPCVRFPLWRGTFQRGLRWREGGKLLSGISGPASLLASKLQLW